MKTIISTLLVLAAIFSNAQNFKVDTILGEPSYVSIDMIDHSTGGVSETTTAAHNIISSYPKECGIDNIYVMEWWEGQFLREMGDTLLITDTVTKNIIIHDDAPNEEVFDVAFNGSDAKDIDGRYYHIEEDTDDTFIGVICSKEVTNNGTVYHMEGGYEVSVSYYRNKVHDFTITQSCGKPDFVFYTKK